MTPHVTRACVSVSPLVGSGSPVAGRKSHSVSTLPPSSMPVPFLCCEITVSIQVKQFYTPQALTEAFLSFLNGRGFFVVCRCLHQVDGIPF